MITSAEFNRIWSKFLRQKPFQMSWDYSLIYSYSFFQEAQIWLCNSKGFYQIVPIFISSPRGCSLTIEIWLFHCIRGNLLLATLRGIKAYTASVPMRYYDVITWQNFLHLLWQMMLQPTGPSYRHVIARLLRNKEIWAGNSPSEVTYKITKCIFLVLSIL